MKSVAIEVYGKVQGVWFRASAVEKARALRLKGFVSNRADGSVYLEVHGAPAAVQSLIEWCHVGPRHAEVSTVKLLDIPSSTAEEFSIKRS